MLTKCSQRINLSDAQGRMESPVGSRVLVVNHVEVFVEDVCPFVAIKDGDGRSIVIVGVGVQETMPCPVDGR